MSILKVILITLLICNGIWLTTSENCKDLLNYLALTQQLYVNCSTTHAVPVKLCTGCEPQYTEMVVAYDAVRENCSSDYFNHDRINVVETTQKMLLGLWDKAFCDDCFNSNNSQVFDEKTANLTLCLKEHPGWECTACVKNYTNLNQFYVSIDEHNNGRVCFDLQDSMNITRVLWSKTLNCCQRELHMTWFVVAASCLGVLPITFYFGAIVLTKRREKSSRMHFNEIISNNSEQQTVPATASIEHYNKEPAVIKPTRLER